MTEINLTQAEADALIALEKHRIDEQPWKEPALGGYLTIPLISADKKENFLLDIRRGRIDLRKGTYQNRARQAVILARLDFGAGPHRNPDGEEISCPHLHVYREGYGDKWAQPLPEDYFSDASDSWRIFDDFLSYCNITRPPIIERGLFT